MRVYECPRDAQRSEGPQDKPAEEMLAGWQQAGDGGLRARPGQAAAHTTRTSLVSDKDDDSRSGNKIYKTPPPGVQAQPKGGWGKEPRSVHWARTW